MKMTDEKFEEKIHVHAIYKGENAEVRITYCTKYDEPQRILLNISESKVFLDLLQKAIADAERRATLKDEQDD